MLLRYQTSMIKQKAHFTCDLKWLRHLDHAEHLSLEQTRTSMILVGCPGFAWRDAKYLGYLDSNHPDLHLASSVTSSYVQDSLMVEQI